MVKSSGNWKQDLPDLTSYEELTSGCMQQTRQLQNHGEKGQVNITQFTEKI